MRVVVTGGTGLVGPVVLRRLLEVGDEPVVLSRDPSKARSVLPAGCQVVGWPGDAAAEAAALEGAAGIINLAGEPIAQRWSPSVKRRLVESRVGTLGRLQAALARCRVRPSVLVSASAVGYYGDRGDEILTEKSPAGSGFLAETCVLWEEAARRAGELGLRTVQLRIGVVLAKEGGALARLLPIFRLGGGGPVGSGRQWMSWIHAEDLASLFVFALKEPEASGPLNAVAPGPVTNRTFAAALGKELRRPAFLPAPAFALSLAFGEMASVLLEGQRVLPARAMELGATFRFPGLEAALHDLLNGGS